MINSKVSNTSGFWSKASLYWPILGLTILAIFEYAFTFRNICHFGTLWHPIIMLLTGFGIFFVAYYRSRQTFTRARQQYPWYVPLIVLCSTFALLFILSNTGIYKVVHIREISSKYSDIIPATQLYVSRFLNGDFPYEIMDFGWIVYPNYLPMRWLPYIPAQLLDIDFRLWTWGVYLFSTAVVLALWVHRGYRLTLIIVATVVFHIFNQRYLKDGSQDLSMTVEFMNVAVYLLLAVAIFSKRWWFIGIAILVCSLSRFSFAFWVPFYLLFLWHEHGFLYPFKIGLLVLVGIIVLYVIPFESQDWGVFFEGLKYYKDAIILEWQPQGWQLPTEAPVHLNRCTGFAYQMLESGSGTVEDKVIAYGRIHLMASFGIMILVSILFWLSKHTIVNKSYFALASLKIYLVVFYAFIAVPYIYLNVLSYIITICLLVFPICKLVAQRDDIKV